MSMLEYYIKQVRGSRGLLHMANLSTLRTYLKSTPISELLQAINNLTEDEHFRTLWEAGLKEPLRSEVLRRIEEVMERRG